MKTLFFVIYKFLFQNIHGVLIFLWLHFIAGLVAATDKAPGWLILLFVGVVWFGGFVLWGFGKMKGWNKKLMP